MELNTLDAQLVRFLRSHENLASRYKNLAETKNDIPFWVAEVFHSDSFPLNTKYKLFECLIYSGNEERRAAWEENQDFIFWGYSNLGSTLLKSVCELFPIRNLATAEAAARNPKWELDIFFDVIRRTGNLEADSILDAEEAVVFFFDNLPASILTKQYIISLIGFIRALQLFIPSYLFDRQDCLSTILTALQEIVIRRVGEDLPYDWAVKLLQDDSELSGGDKKLSSKP